MTLLIACLLIHHTGAASVWYVVATGLWMVRQFLWFSTHKAPY